MRIVVLGWGNDARGDDALGPLLLRRIAGWSIEGVETIEDYQLQIEHALDLVGFDAVLFIDASRDAPAPFAFHETAARESHTPTTHALGPEAVLGVFVKLTGAAPPPAFVLALRGQRFGLGEGLSAEGVQALAAAETFCLELLAAPTLEAWRSRAAGASSSQA